MAQPKVLTKADAVEVIKAIEQGILAGGLPPGKVTKKGKTSAYTLARREKGWTQAEFRARLEHAKALGMAPKIPAKPKEQIIPPVLPSKDEPIEETWARLESEQERKAAFAKATEWMPFQVPGKEPFGLVFVGDPHMDQCDAKLLRSHLDLIDETPRMWAVGLGDWVNAWVGKYRGLYSAQTVTEAQAYRLVKAVFARKIWLLLILGNHDGERWHGQGSPLRWMEHAATVDPVDWQAKFSIQCGGTSWKIWAAHNFPGHSQFNVLHGPTKRALHTGGEANLYIAGDRHTFGIAEGQHEFSGKPYWVARAKGYKLFDNYPLELGFGPGQTTGHSVAAIFDPRDGSLQCFSDVPKAAAYLKFLQKGV